MARIKKIQTSFVSGEIDPTIYGRVLTDIYGKASAKLRNVYVRPQGGVFRREGLEYIDTTTSSQKAKIVPFEFNDEQTYILVFTPGEFKVYRTDVNGVQATVSSAPISGLNATHIDEMNWTQSADTLILVHKDFQPIEIKRAGHTSWTATNITFSNIPTFDYGSGNEPLISATRGWMRSVAFWKGRLWFGGLGSRPQTILASVIGLYYDLNEGTGLEDQAINVTIDDDRVNIINNIFPGRGLQIFTSGGEFTIRSSVTDAVTPENIADQVSKETLHGSGRVRPHSVDGTTVFIEEQGSVVRQFVFNDVEQSFNSPNISILAQHLINDPVSMDIRRAVEAHPSDYLYIVNSDGTVAVLSSLREQDLLAWSLFETNGFIEDVAVSGRITYFIVRRNVNGVDVRFIERLNQLHYTDASVLSDNGSPTSSWSGYDHLNSESIVVRGDDYILDDVIPSGGAFTSSAPVSILEAGFNFSAVVKSLPIDVIIEGQSFSGEWKDMVSANINLYESRNISVSYSGNNRKPSFRRFGNNVLDAPIDKFNGWKKVYLGGYNRDIQVEITQDEPLEFNILSINYEVRV